MLNLQLLCIQFKGSFKIPIESSGHPSVCPLNIFYFYDGVEDIFLVFK